MSDSVETNAPSSSSRGRGRGRGSHKSRGGLGKYLRARGRGGRGRPAEFRQRLVLDGEEEAELDEEEVEEMRRKYSRRQLGSNVDRYAEPEPKLDSEGEEVLEPEVDLSAFLERQRLSEGPPPVVVAPEEDADDIDTSLVHHSVLTRVAANTKKGKVQRIEWDESLETLSREKASADATRELKERFRARAARERNSSSSHRNSRRTTKEKSVIQAPALPIDKSEPDRSAKEEMQDFLDDLLG